MTSTTSRWAGYHDAFTRTDRFDDDGDGTPDRTVYAMLFDFQAFTEGGSGYVRLMHFDNQGKKITVRTYSPSLDDFDADDPTLEQQHQEFTIDYASAGIASVTKTLSTDGFSADVLGTDTIASFADVASGATVEATWSPLTPGEHGWYVETTDPYGAVHRSDVRTFTTVKTPDPVDQPFTQAPVPTIRGTVKVGSRLIAVAGAWQPAPRLTYQWKADGRDIRGATGAVLTVGAAQAGRRLTVVVTGALAGRTTTARTSRPTAPVARGTFAASRPIVRGKAKVGRTLRVSTGAWTPRPSIVRYQWFANGRAIRGATRPALRVTKSMRGKRITVRVTGASAGYTTRTVVSAPSARVRR